MTVACLGASWFAPYSSTTVDLLHPLAGPSVHHLLGTDQLGRDILSRLMFGGRGALLGVVEATAVFVLVGVSLGTLAGYFGGAADHVVTRSADVIVALPGVLILLVVLAVFPQNETSAMVAFGLLAAPGLIRVTRSETLRIKGELYVSAARVSGLRDYEILSKHIVRRLGTLIIVQAALLASVALLVQAGLAFLGLGPQEPAPSWGGMVNEASLVIGRDSWMLVPTGGVIALSVMALGLIGDGLRDASAARWSRSGLAARRVKRRSPRRITAEGADLVGAPGALLNVNSLTVGFATPSGLRTVVEDVSFVLMPGEIVGLIGESGCGKSVTATAILGLLPANAHVSGACVFDGLDLAALSESGLRAVRGRRIAYVSQEPMTALDPTVRIGALLVEALRRHRKLSKAAARKAAVDLLAQVNLRNPEAVARRYPHQISGGMAQRVAIALALAGEPDLIIADEPTSALDVTVQAEIIALLQGLQARRGLSMIVITHDWAVVSQLCSRAFVMYAGQIVETGSVRQLYHQTSHPYTAGLLDANPRRALELVTAEDDRLRLPAIPGTVPAPELRPVSCHFQDRCPYVADVCREGPVPLVDLGDGQLSRCRRIDELKRRRQAS